MARFPNKILTSDLLERFKSRREWIRKLTKITKMIKIQISPERSKAGFSGPLMMIIIR